MFITWLLVSTLSAWSVGNAFLAFLPSWFGGFFYPNDDTCHHQTRLYQTDFKLGSSPGGKRSPRPLTLIAQKMRLWTRVQIKSFIQLYHKYILIFSLIHYHSGSGKERKRYLSTKIFQTDVCQKTLANSVRGKEREREKLWIHIPYPPPQGPHAEEIIIIPRLDLWLRYIHT